MLQTMRAGLSQCRPHSSIQGQALTGYKHMGQLFGLLWELPGGPARIAALHEGLKDCSIHIHGSCTEVVNPIRYTPQLSFLLISDCCQGFAGLLFISLFTLLGTCSASMQFWRA